jgi:hypothetical protein
VEEKYREALLQIGAEHPAWSKNPDDVLVKLFNRVTRIARDAVNAKGYDDDAKADWCSNELDIITGQNTATEHECHRCHRPIEGIEDGIDCTECHHWFCDSCYDTDKGDGCHCHQ